MTMVVVMPTPDAATATYDDRHEDHADEAEDDADEPQPQGGAPVGGIVEVRQRADPLLADEDDREVDAEDDKPE